MIANRFNPLGVRLMPYDAEVEFIASNGQQWIDLQTKPDLSTKIYIDVVAESSHPNIIATDFNTNIGIHITNWGVGSWAVFFGNKGYIPLQGREPVALNVLTTISIDRESVTFNGSKWDIGATSMSGDSLMLLYNAWDLFQGEISRVYNCKVLNGDTLVRDFIPVRIGDVGYMFDKVSRRLFGNSGTGKFILGADK